MAELTLLKLEFPDADFTAKAPFSGNDEAETAAAVDGSDEEDSSGVLPLLLGLVFLVVVAVAVRKVLGSDEELTGDEVVAAGET